VAAAEPQKDGRRLPTQHTSIQKKKVTAHKQPKQSTSRPVAAAEPRKDGRRLPTQHTSIQKKKVTAHKQPKQSTSRPVAAAELPKDARHAPTKHPLSPIKTKKAPSWGFFPLRQKKTISASIT
jgi:hypothetical protein